MINMQIRDKFGWVDGEQYPLEMVEYMEKCEMKLRKIIHILTEQFGTGICADLKMSMDRTRFDLTSKPVEKDYSIEFENNFLRHMEFERFGHLIYSNEVERYEREHGFTHKINLTYEVQLHWLRRPHAYTNYYSTRFMDMLKEEDIKFTCDEIKWLSDESNGQMFGEKFLIDFSTEISEEHAKMLSEEFNRING